jgi:hypothetical protein
VDEKDDLILAALARLESGQESLQVVIKKEFSDLWAAVNALQDTAIGVGEGLITLREDQTSLRVGLMERMDRLQNILNSIRDDVTVSMGRGDHAERIALHTREELRTLSEVVSAMHKQIAHLQTQMREPRGDP